MDYASLYDLIVTLQSRTKLHIGVNLFENPQNELLDLPRAHTIHTSPICEHVKTALNRYVRCRECRLHATDRAIRTREPFFEFCHAGVLEYTHPICVEQDILGVIFVGNVYEKAEGSAPLRAILTSAPSLEATMEHSVERAECEQIGRILESYIRLLYARSPIPAKSGSLCERIKHFLDNNLEYEPDAKRIGLLLHYNEKYLGRIFKKETGLSIAEYRNQRRLSLCSDFLKHSDEPISTIASRLGFENVSYFNRLFKAHYGLSPTEYRLSQRKPPQSE